MLKASGKTIIMNEGDYGLGLPFKITGKDVLTTDTFKFTIKENEYSDDIIYEKEFTNLSNEDDGFVFILSFSKEESEKISFGEYVYGIKQYRNNKFINTILNKAKFKVEKGV